MALKSVTVTLTTAHTLYNLLTLAVAIDPGFKSVLTGSSSARELSLQADPTNTGKIYLGDSQTADPSTTQRCGYVLLASGTAFHRGVMDDVPFSEWYAMPDTNAQKLNILVSRK